MGAGLDTERRATILSSADLAIVSEDDFRRFDWTLSQTSLRSSGNRDMIRLGSIKSFGETVSESRI